MTRSHDVVERPTLVLHPQTPLETAQHRLHVKDRQRACVGDLFVHKHQCEHAGDGERRVPDHFSCRHISSCLIKLENKVVLVEQVEVVRKKENLFTEMFASLTKYKKILKAVHTIGNYSE